MFCANAAQFERNFQSAAKLGKYLSFVDFVRKQDVGGPKSVFSGLYILQNGVHAFVLVFENV
jgi:hypothetical protein